jgi:hypothetical protein
MSDICVHLYALCWNEERMLPFFFRHYDALVDRYLIFDNKSSDRSRELLEVHPRVTLDRFEFQGSFLEAARSFYDNCWKASRGIADWVLVCNVDEHLDHPNLASYLGSCTRQGITLIVPEGYEMVSREFPEGKASLCQQVRTGARWARLDKPQLFSPDHVREINFESGRHTARPEGLVKCPDKTEVRLLHYKYLGLDYVSQRLTELGGKIPPVDIRGQNHYYEWNDEQKQDEFRRLLKSAVALD